MLENELIKNVQTFRKSAEMIYQTGDFTSATILYFKTLFSVLDWIILQKEGNIPKDHEERFRILEIKFSDLYVVLDSIFRIYRATYRTSVSAEDCEKVRKHVREIIERYKLAE